MAKNLRSRKTAVASGRLMGHAVAASCSSLNAQISLANFSASRFDICLHMQHMYGPREEG
jgi:hypothetical protein